MSWELRVMLFIGAFLTLVYFLAQIRKSRLQIDYAISWTIFSVCIFLLSIFPDIGDKISKLLGFDSPANLIYLVVIFILIIKLFTTTIKLSEMNRQIIDLSQHIALSDKEDKLLDK